MGPKLSAAATAATAAKPRLELLSWLSQVSKAVSEFLAPPPSTADFETGATKKLPVTSLTQYGTFALHKDGKEPPISTSPRM